MPRIQESDDMATDQGPVVTSALLRRELVRLRQEKKFTQEQVAADLEWSSSKLIRVEGGHSAITRTDLDALLNLYSVTSHEGRERMQALNRGARERAWWDEQRADFPATYMNYIGYEAGASFIRQYQGTVMPGLLQIRAYAHAMTAATIYDDSKIDSAVKLRVRRREELAKRVPQPYQFYVLDEAVLRRHVGWPTDPAVMPAQLREIAARAKAEERLMVRVIPFANGAHAGLTGGPFTLLEFEGGLSDILYLDAGKYAVNMIAGDDARVTEYRDGFEKLLGQALPASESIDFILAVAEEMP
jgi:transcriptional regulator with XRE-family HTH domain